MRVIIKTSTELDKLRSSGRILGIVHKKLKQLVLPGVTTMDIEDAARKLIESYDAVPSFLNYRGYPFCTCISVNDEIVHGFPSSRELRLGDVVSVDCGVRKNGYHTDATFTKLVGHTNNTRLSGLVETANECLELTISKVKAGITTGTIGSIIEEYVSKKGYEIVKEYVGHGIGAELHEYPAIYNYGSRGTGVVLKAGSVIAIEPIIVTGKSSNKVLNNGWTVVTVDSSKAAHVEQTVIVHDGYAESITLF